MHCEPILSATRIANMTAQGLWQNRLICDFLDATAQAKPDATAIVEHRSATNAITRITYGELQKASLRIAAALIGLGVQRNDVVAVQLPNWWQFAAIHIACVRIGAITNPLMPIFRERELEFMLGFAEARVIIVPKEFRGCDYPAMLAGLRPALPALERVLAIGGQDPASAFETCVMARAWETEMDLAAVLQERRPDPNDVTEIIYTSGTTGQPKGVMHTANTLLCKALLASELLSFGLADSIFMGSPLAHQTGFMYAAILAVYQASKCVLQDVWDPAVAARLIAAERCTITLGSTPFLSDLVQLPADAAPDLSSLRLFACAGAPIPSVLVEAAAQRYPQLYVMSAWGMTEMGISTATYPGDPPDKVFDTDGRALPFHAVRIVDEAGTVVPLGIEGRLQARCATLFVGYLRRPADYGVDDELWFETGDNARLDKDGYIRITGRSKDLIIRGGENIPVVEVEGLLYRHPAVEDCAVVGMPDARLGERGCAFVTLRPGGELDLAGMVSYLLACKLTKQYLPERLEILPEFPRTASGKIQKFKLRALAQAF